jgi:hypothetical protein
MIPPDAQDATPMFVMLLRELADLQARSQTNQKVCERILELIGEDAVSIRSAVSKIHADSHNAAMKRLIARLRAAFPDAPPEFFLSFSE